MSRQTLQSLEVYLSLLKHPTAVITSHNATLQQAELDAGQSMAALRRFSDNLAKLPENEWGKPFGPELRIVFQHLPDDNHPGIIHPNQKS